MSTISRRNLLRAGGAVGALGAIAASPARPAWTWSARRSVAGSGPAADPRWVWDEVADPVVARIIDDGDVAQVNAALRQWTRNDQPVPAGMPGYVRDFVEQARELPPWLDEAKLAAAVDFNETRGLYLGLLYGLGSGMLSTAIPAEARAVYYSLGGGDMKDRIAKTAKLGYDIGTPNAFRPDGEMIVTAVKTRMIHAAIRHLLPQSPHWDAVEDRPIPISQADMLVTWHSLPTTIMQKMAEWPIQVTAAHAEGYLHLWQVAAYVLGIREEYIPASWAAADEQSTQLLDPVLGPTREGVELARILTNLAAEMDGGVTRPMIHAMTRYVLGDQVADWIEIPREPIWDPMVENGWPPFVASREGLLRVPFTPAGAWAFDEMLRQGLLLFLSEGRPISIEIPDANRSF